MATKKSYLAEYERLMGEKESLWVELNQARSDRNKADEWAKKVMARMDALKTKLGDAWKNYREARQHG